jgi:hypothetical protein
MQIKLPCTASKAEYIDPAISSVKIDIAYNIGGWGQVASVILLGLQKISDLHHLLFEGVGSVE